MPVPLTTEDKLEYILTCLKHCGELKPDYHKVAEEKKMTSANTAQKAFKKYIEESGKFKLSSGTVIEVDGSSVVAPVTPTKPTAKARTSKETPKKATTKNTPKTIAKDKVKPKKRHGKVIEDKEDSSSEAMDIEDEQADQDLVQDQDEGLADC